MDQQQILIIGFAATTVVLTFLLAVFSYVHRLYEEKGRGRTRRIRSNLEHFHDNIAGRLKMDASRAVQTFGLLSQLTLVLVALVIGFAAVLFAEDYFRENLFRGVFNIVFLVTLEIVLVYQFTSYFLLSRSRGDWLIPIIPLLRLFGYLVMPLLAFYGFGVSLLHLVEEEEVGPPRDEEQVQAIEDLVEEGQERGIFEQEDVALIASVLEFADRTARDVMTPRPDLVGIGADRPVSELRALMREKRLSRVLVYGKSMDEVLGSVSVHDVLGVPESDSESTKVEKLRRPVLFVPETKRVVELVSELQQRQSQLVAVVDEYGKVAGLVTIRDLAEEVIGEISDADQVRRAEILQESPGEYFIRAGADLYKVAEALGLELNSGGNTTFAGLVHSWFGYIPRPGEQIEKEGVKVEILEATARRVVRVRATLTEADAAGEAAARSGGSR